MEGNLDQQSATQQIVPDTPNKPQPSPEITSPPSTPATQHKRKLPLKVLSASTVILLGPILSAVLWYLQSHYLFYVYSSWYQHLFYAASALLPLLFGILILYSDKLWPQPTIRRRWLTAVALVLILSGVLWYIEYSQKPSSSFPFPQYFIALPVLTMTLLILIRIGYTPKASKLTGFGDYAPPQHDYQRSKTLWDWLQLLIVPVILAAGALWFNAQQDSLNQQTIMSQQQEAALQGYFTNMSDLLLKNELTDPKTQLDASQLAHVWTLTTLRQLDPERKGIVLRFLYDANLIGKFTPPSKKGNPPTIIKPIVDLRDADFSDIYFYNYYPTNEIPSTVAGADLSGADLDKAFLPGVDLTHTNLSYVDFTSAYLLDAHLDGANLSNTEFYDAVLDGAILTRATGFNSEGVKSLSGTTMPDGTKHP